MGRTIIDVNTRKKVSEAFDLLTIDDTKIPAFFCKVLNFQGKKSYLSAKKIISYVTNSEDLIFDPFFGTGSFLIASALANRHVIGTELDNYTYNAVSVLLSKCDNIKLEVLFNQVKESCQDFILSLYETSCCGQKNHISKLHFDPETNEYYNPTPHRDIIDGRNIKLSSRCPICKKTDKKFDDNDMRKIMEMNQYDTSRFPSHRLIENSRINITSSTGADKYDSNFTTRSKIALIRIQDSISNLSPCIERDILEYALVFSIALSKIAMYGSGTNNLYHVLKNSAQEMNVWELFEDKLKQIKNYKKELNSVLQTDFNGSELIEIYNIDYASYLSQTNKRFKVIYTDPPYTDQVPYLEYQQYYRDWLKTFYDKDKYELLCSMLDQEMVVSNAPSRTEKNMDNYFVELDKMFHLFYDHMYDDGLVFLTIKLGEKKYFTVLTKYIELARKNGFEFVCKHSITNNDPTIRRQAAYINTLSTQIVVAFQKVSKASRCWYIGNINIEKRIIEIAYNSIVKSNSHSVLLPVILNLIRDDLFFRHAISFSNEDNSRAKCIIEAFFVIDTASNVQINPNEFYAGLEDKKSLFIKLYDTVPVLINKLLKSKGKFTLDDLYYEIANLLCEYDPSLFDIFLENEKYKVSINTLLDNYCEQSHNVYIKRRIKNAKQEGAIDISTMDGYEFEDLIKKLLIKQGYGNVTRLGGAGDRGIDLIATEPFQNNRKVIFQCKRWISNVGSEPIQRLHSMLVVDTMSIKKAICITTSDYTSDGKDIAKLTGVEIINGLELLKQLEKYFPGQFYHGALTIPS